MADMDSDRNRYRKPRRTTTHQYLTLDRNDGQAQLHDYLHRVLHLYGHPRSTSPVRQTHYRQHSHQSHQSHQLQHTPTTNLNHHPDQANTTTPRLPRLLYREKSHLALPLQPQISMNSLSSPQPTWKTANPSAASSCPPNSAPFSYKRQSATRDST
jgi:hypothetical protein